MTQVSHLTPISERLIYGLQRIQATLLDIPLVPLNGNKQPLGDGWQNRPFTAAELIQAIQNGGVEVPIKGEIKKIQLQGFGLLTGRPITIDGATYYLMAIDQDGKSAIEKILGLSGGEPLPKTVAFSSGRTGRCQYLFKIPEEYKNAIRTKKVKTGVNGDDGKGEQVEFRWSNLQSVLPPSVHPTTGEYHWIEGCAIDEVEIALAPMWMIEQMLIEPTREATPRRESISKLPAAQHSSTAIAQKQWTELDFANSYLNALSQSRADDYDCWLTVGMALHSVSDSLLSEWDKWSQQSAKYKPGECEKKWKSFSTNGGISLGSLGHLAKQDGWRNPFTNGNGHVSHNQFHCQNGTFAVNTQQNKKTVTGDSSPLSDSLNSNQHQISATVTSVTTILKSGLKDYSERSELDALQARSVMSKAAFWEMVAAIRCSLDEVQPEDTKRFNQLIDWHNATLDLKKVLPHPIADAFLHDAQVLNIDPVSLWQYFLPAVLSTAGQRVNLDVESHLIPAIIWTCIVGESGTGKSRAESIILAPLKKLQHQEKKRWKQDLKKYRQALKNKGKDDPEPEPPQPERKYLFEVATIQAVMRRLAEQGENGSLWARDEIAGLFKSLGQFQARSGENEGLECLLKMWDGSGSFVDRVNAEEDSYAVDQTRLSIAGGIQPGAFRAAFKDPNDAQGLQARFLYAVPKVKKAKRVKGYCQLSDLLGGLYDWLDQCPRGTIKLSPEADHRYTSLVEQIGEQAETSATPAIRAWMRKLPTQLLRIALVLHLVECYYERHRCFWELQLNTLERAVEVCRYYRSAFQVVQEKAADSNSSSSILLKIWDMAVTQPDGVTPRDIYRAIKAIGRRAAEVGRTAGAYTLELLDKLVQMGKGILEKNGRSYRFKATLNPPEHPTDPDSPNRPLNPTPPTTPTGEGSESVAPDSSQELSNNFPETVTEVTEAQSQTESVLELSPALDVSPVTIENPPVVEQHADSQPTLAELQGMLLACQTLSALKELKKQNTSQRMEEAYSALPFDQQLKVDGVSAKAVPFQVFKYTGQKRSNSEGFEIKAGMLVYLDNQSRQTAYSANVWALNGVKEGQRSPVSLERDKLVQVEKAVNGLTS